MRIRYGSADWFSPVLLEPLADAIADAATLAVERPRRLVIEETLAAQRRHRHQPVSAEPVDGGKEAERLHPGDPRRDDLPHFSRKPGRDIAVDRLALGRHRAAFEVADRLADARPSLEVDVTNPGPFGPAPALAEIGSAARGEKVCQT